MPESPDFEAIARRVAEETGIGRLEDCDVDDPERVVTAIAEQLRLVWNARGAADAAIFFGEQEDRWVVKAISELDR